MDKNQKNTDAQHKKVAASGSDKGNLKHDTSSKKMMDESDGKTEKGMHASPGKSEMGQNAKNGK